MHIFEISTLDSIRKCKKYGGKDFRSKSALNGHHPLGIVLKNFNLLWHQVFETVNHFYNHHYRYLLVILFVYCL